MQTIASLAAQYGLPLVFLSVLLESLGVPIPAMPVLIVAGALCAASTMSLPGVVVLALIACVAGDMVWFSVGRAYGGKVLKLLCRISLSPDSCVRQTENFYDRWGSRTLLFAKFIPGLATVAPPLAGAAKLPRHVFVLFDLAGSLIWIAVSLAIGAVFSSQIDRVGALLTRLGTMAFFVLGALLAAFLAFKWWERRRLYRTLRMARISAEELRRLMLDGHKPVILDVRSESARKLDTREIPGALPVDVTQPALALAGLPPGTEVVVFCTCPNEASAARVARALMDLGFRRVRPLAGGLDAWYESEAKVAVEISTPPVVQAGVAIAPLIDGPGHRGAQG
jgi:membrane protein DedA with SNARE-associated domain/rhodanese-related sulfurtransferase